MKLVSAPIACAAAYAISLLLLLPQAFAQDETRCDFVRCNAGSKVVSYAKKSDPYYACPSQELADYVEFVVLLYQEFGSNISPASGEPELVDQVGLKKILDFLRMQANVETFFQAAASCKNGKNTLRLVVANYPEKSTSMWVLNEKTKEFFWMPKSHLHLQK